MNIDKQITTLELRYNRRLNVQTAVALTVKCWWAYKNADMLADPPADPRSYLHKAHHTVLAALRKNESHVRLFMLAIFIAIEAERFDSANEMLDKAMGYRSFLRSNEPFYYAVLRFLYAYLEIRQKRARSARKHIRALQEFIAASPDNPAYDLMQGMLSLSFYEFDKAYMFLTAAYGKGNRSLFLYQSLYVYYRTSVNAPSGPTLLPVLGWAAAHKVDVADIIGVYPDELRTAIVKNPGLGEMLYENAPHPFVLREICSNRMMAADFSPAAFKYYREAERRQIYLNGLYTFLIKAARENDADRINHYAMTEFLRSSERQHGSIDTGLAVYVYHLLLTDPVLTDLVAERKNIILQLATYCLEHKYTGREANSLYAYYWEQCKIMGVSGELLDNAEARLFEDLTRFEVSVPEDVKYLYVTEPEKKGMTVYEITDGPVVLDAVGDDMTFTCLNAGRKAMLAVKPTVRRMVHQAGLTLYRYFFMKKAGGFTLSAYLGNRFLAGLDEMDESGINEAVRVFETLLDEKDCAKPYRMRILAALGRLYYAGGHFAKALEHYGAVDESELDDQYLEQILHVFLQTHEWARAIGLVSRRGLRMERQALFDAIKRLSGPDMAAHHKDLAGVAYELLVGGCYGADLLSIVLAHFQGSQEEWQTLSQALDRLGVNEPQVDEILLKGSLWMHRWDMESQKAFVRLCGQTAPTAGLLARYAEYVSYEVLVNAARPEYEVLALLENAYTESGDDMIAWALCHIYLRHNLTTFKSERILKDAVLSQEEAGILFPVFREHRFGSPTPYIEKNHPFIYRGLPDKDVWLYYRIDEGSAFNARRMTYFRFGLYLTVLPLFYNEYLTYYFSEEMPTGSITTKDAQVRNNAVYLHESNTDDVFYTINNAIIYEQMFKYEQVERIINGLVKDVNPVRSVLL
jgi:hypothetical protein